MLLLRNVIGRGSSQHEWCGNICSCNVPLRVFKKFFLRGCKRRMTQCFFNPMQGGGRASLVERLLGKRQHGLQTSGRQRAKLGDLQRVALIESALCSGRFRAQPTFTDCVIGTQNSLGGVDRVLKSIS